MLVCGQNGIGLGENLLPVSVSRKELITKRKMFKISIFVSVFPKCQLSGNVQHIFQESPSTSREFLSHSEPHE